MGVSEKIKFIALPGGKREGDIAFSRRSPIGKALLDDFNRVVATGKFDEMKMIEEYER
jgi:hypothetical protein